MLGAFFAGFPELHELLGREKRRKERERGRREGDDRSCHPSVFLSLSLLLSLERPFDACVEISFAENRERVSERASESGSLGGSQASEGKGACDPTPVLLHRSSRVKEREVLALDLTVFLTSKSRERETQVESE